MRLWDGVSGRTACSLSAEAYFEAISKVAGRTCRWDDKDRYLPSYNVCVCLFCHTRYFVKAESELL